MFALKLAYGIFSLKMADLLPKSRGTPPPPPGFWGLYAYVSGATITSLSLVATAYIFDYSDKILQEF